MRTFIISVIVLISLFYFTLGYSGQPSIGAFNFGPNMDTPGIGNLVPKRILPSGARLGSGESISAPNKDFWLTCQKDGNLVLYHRGQPLWDTRTYGMAVRECVMERDGNLVLYEYSHNAVWASNTQGNPGAYLAVQDDGNVVIYVPECPIWSTGTNR